jgi:hypothetical protein
VQLPQATHLAGLIFIVFLFLKKLKRIRRFGNLPGLEGLPRTSARLFACKALRTGSVDNRSQDLM